MHCRCPAPLRPFARRNEGDAKTSPTLPHHVTKNSKTTFWDCGYFRPQDIDSAAKQIEPLFVKMPHDLAKCGAKWGKMIAKWGIVGYYATQELFAK